MSTNGHLPSMIIDDQEKKLFKVNRQAFVSNDVLDSEKQYLFNNCWIYAGHVSEVADSGDYRTRRVAGRPVIISRGDDDKIRVMMNTCPHRGATVRREPSGNSKIHQCYYHGWTFNNEGTLIGLPGENAYENTEWTREDNCLTEAPKVESYRGLIFASFNSNIQPLEDYLAGAKEYLDLVMDQTEVGMEVVGGTQEYSMKANWKLLIENSIDGYHAPTTHKRYFDFIVGTNQLFYDMSQGIPGSPHALGNGHAVIEYDSPWGRPIARWTPYFGEERKEEFEVKKNKLVERFGEERAERISRYSRNLFIFPNLIVNDIMAITIRTFFPVTPDYMEIRAWALAPKDESPDDRALRLDNYLTFLGPGGYATPDDVEALEACQRGFATFRELQWSDISRGMGRDDPKPDDELQMRTFWRQWNELMTGRQLTPSMPQGVGI
ncbi:MAG: p-cumate dioxygenase [Chloroflexi bacterium]|nr:p-cumate dioxygenase [Chloroflexota bacterium]